MTRRLFWLPLLFAACIPATPPPHLGATPGAAIIVSGERYVGDGFSADYPAGWRAITSPADEPPFVIFAAPDNCTVIIVSLDERTAPEPAGCEAELWQDASHTRPGTPTVYAAVRASTDVWADAENIFEAVVTSIATQ